MSVSVCLLHSEVIVTLLHQRRSHAPPGGPSTPGHWALQAVILQILALLLSFLIFLVILVHINLAVFSLKQQGHIITTIKTKSS